MVRNAIKRKKAKPGVVTRVVYSALGLSVIGGAIAVLGAPTKWTYPETSRAQHRKGSGRSRPRNYDN